VTENAVTTRHELSATARDRLTSWFDQKGVITPSINYAVFDRTGVLFHHGIGEFQCDGRTPQVDTIYRIASMSKSFCIATVLVLAERGLLSLEDPVSAHIEQFHDYVDPFGAEIPITIRMLMSNSSGLPEDNAWADYHLGLTRNEILAIVARGLNFSDYPDTSYQYSNISFCLLGVIVENLTGRPFADFATETLLAPLGLTSTRYDWQHYPDGGEGGAGIAYGFETFDEGKTWFQRPFVGTGVFGCAGSMFSTLVDIAKWSGWLSSAFDAENADDAILTRASRRLMQRIFTPIHSMEPRMARSELDNIGYGLGLVVEQDSRFGAIAQHSGGLPGFSTNMRWHTSSGLGVIIFTNTNGQPPALWAADLLRIVLEDADVPAKLVPLWPATVDAARAVEAAIFGSGHVADAERLFSPNVLSDVPSDLRDSRLAEAIEAVGGLLEPERVQPISERLNWAISAAHLCWSIPGNGGTIQCRMEMTETTPSLIQRLDIEVTPEGGDDQRTLVVRHFTPVVAPVR
jgi:CubicO group peptidase (beta-lactamase class C family)